MQNRSQNVFTVVLAAGTSSRFGKTKQAAKLDGVPLVQKALRTATRVCGDHVITVVGHDAKTVLRAMQADSGFIVFNEDFESGMGSSIAKAVRACPPQTDAVLVLLADQPLVTADHLKTLLKRWSGDADEIVATAYAGTEGPPVLLPRATFGELKKLSGDTGARALFHDARFRLTTVPLEDGAIDIDTPGDLTRI